MTTYTHIHIHSLVISYAHFFPSGQNAHKEVKDNTPNHKRNVFIFQVKRVTASTEARSHGKRHAFTDKDNESFLQHTVFTVEAILHVSGNAWRHKMTDKKGTHMYPLETNGYVQCVLAYRRFRGPLLHHGLNCYVTQQCRQFGKLCASSDSRK
jgi:hypothetical protein